MNTPASPNTPALPMPVTKRAHGRSLADFGKLLQAEETLLASSALGEVAKIGDDVPADDSDPNKVVRASFLRFLLLGGDEQAPVHEKGVQLSGAWIQDELDLENCVVPHGIDLSNCKFDKPIIARDAHIAGPLNLSGCHLLQGLHANRLRCGSDVFLRSGFQSFAEIHMPGAKIGGNLECSGGLFDPKEGYAILADSSVVRGDVFMKGQFKATGTVRLLGAQIGGNLECSGGLFEPKEGDALLADQTFFNGGVFLDKQFKATGTVRLLAVQIGSSLNCSDGLFEPKEGDALSAERAVIKGNVLLNKQFKATGTVRLLAAQIGCNLDCSGGIFESRESHVLIVDHAEVKGNVFLKKQFKATGEVRILGAQIGGNLECTGGLFEPKEGSALNADRIVVKGNVFLDEQFKATGTIRLLGAQIDGDLACTSGQFSARIGDALQLHTATIQGRFLLCALVAPVRVDANLEFLKYLKRLGPPKQVERFMVSRKSTSSCISLMPEYLRSYITELNYLFSEIHTCTDDANTAVNYHSFYNFGNNLRKFLEAFLFFKYPSNSVKKDWRLKLFFGDEVGALSLVNRFLNP